MGRPYPQPLLRLLLLQQHRLQDVVHLRGAAGLGARSPKFPNPNPTSGQNTQFQDLQTQAPGSRLYTPSRLKRSLLQQGAAPPGARSAATEHTGTVSTKRARLRTRGRACAGGASRLSPVPIEVTSTKRFTPLRAAASTRLMLPCAPRRRRRKLRARCSATTGMHRRVMGARCPVCISMHGARSRPAPAAARARQSS